MLGRKEDDVEFECPVCGTVFKATAREAAKGKVRCPRGHEFAVMGMLGGLEGGPGRGPIGGPGERGGQDEGEGGHGGA